MSPHPLFLPLNPHLTLLRVPVARVLPWVNLHPAPCAPTNFPSFGIVTKSFGWTFRKCHRIIQPLFKKPLHSGNGHNSPAGLDSEMMYVLAGQQISISSATTVCS